MMQMGDVHEIYGITRRFLCFQCLILLDKTPLPIGIGFARNQFGLFVDIAQSMQLLGHAAFAVNDLPRLFNVMGDFLRSEIKLCSKMPVQRLPLFFIECGVATAGFGFLQGRQATFSITLEVIADGFTTNQQGFRNSHRVNFQEIIYSHSLHRSCRWDLSKR